MDGPSVNWNVLDMYLRKEMKMKMLLVIGSWSQHVLHGVFKNGVTITITKNFEVYALPFSRFSG